MLYKKNDQARHIFNFFFEKSVFRNLTFSKYYIVQNYLYGAVI